MRASRALDPDHGDILPLLVPSIATRRMISRRAIKIAYRAGTQVRALRESQEEFAESTLISGRHPIYSGETSSR